jgi:hypothetical protein
MTAKQQQSAPSLKEVAHIVSQSEAFLADYMVFSDPLYALVGALWAFGTWVYQGWDVYPYLLITAATKRSGKTRFAECLSMLSCRGKQFSAMTPAVLFRTIGQYYDDGVTIFFDEAEELSAEGNAIRPMLNVGYRRGQTIPRVVGGVVEEFPVYCPKAFILIGDPYDTLRDRAIRIELHRGLPRTGFVWSDALSRAQQIVQPLAVNKDTRQLVIESIPPADVAFLEGGREAELWQPILSLCSLLLPDRVKDVQRVAADLAATKTHEKTHHRELAHAEAEATNDTYAVLALRHLDQIIGGDSYISNVDAVKRLREIPTAPWRTFRDEHGLTVIMLANLLNTFVRPAVKKISGKPVRVYRAIDVRAAIAKL